MNKNYNLFSWQKVKNTAFGLLALFSASTIDAQLASNSFNTPGDLGDWSVVQTSGTSTNEGWKTVASGENMGSAGLAPFSGGGMAQFNCYNINNGNTYELNSPAIQFTGGEYQVSFWMYRYDTYSGSKDKIEVFYNTVAGSTGGTSLGIVNRLTTEEPVESAEGWYEYTFAIPGNPNGEGYISILGISAYGYNIFIDEVVVDEVPTCFKPTNIAYTDITDSSAKVSWNVPTSSSPSSYEYYYSEQSDAPTADTTPSGTTSTTEVTLSGLTPLTNYNVWVRSVCSDTDKSVWAIGGSFKTACGTYTVEYTNNYDSVGYGETPECWTTKMENQTGFPDNGLSTSQFVSAPNSMLMYNSSDTTGSYYLISPKFSDLDNMKEISFQVYREIKSWSSSSSTDRIFTLEVGVMTDANDTSTYQTIQDITQQVDLDQWKEIKVSTDAYTGGAAHIVIKWKPTQGDATGGYNTLYYDDFKYKEKQTLATGETVLNTNEVVVYPNPFKDVVKINNIDNVTTINLMDMSGRVVSSFAPAKELNLAHLDAGVYVIQLVYKDGSVKTVKSIKK
ncbi:MAG: hypothetical protein CSA38_03855 [Flavobacteriales bacterium]|nr:MAG: hypothetical protein CSA38_03855 [Flavobacteriales bacterium]